MTKHEIAEALKQIAFFLSLKGDNPYKAQAYERAGTALLTSPFGLQELLATGTLTEVTGIGPATARAITELATTGQSPLLDEARGSYPSSLATLGEVPGLSRKQIVKLYEQAHITSLADLKAACRDGRLVNVPGIGPKVQAKLQDALGEYVRGQGYHLYADVVDEAQDLARALKRFPEIRAVSMSGAIRRKMEVVNEYVFVVACDKPNAVTRVMNRLPRIPNVTEVHLESDTITARSPIGLPLRIIVTSSRDFGHALLHSTGSAEHLDELLRQFQTRGLKDWHAVQAKLPNEDEAALYAAVELPYLPPELREGRGEVNLASRGTLPSLLEPRQIQGVFHIHTDDSDGAGTLDDMVSAARQRGYRYLGISDHSQSAFYANGLKEPEEAPHPRAFAPSLHYPSL